MNQDHVTGIPEYMMMMGFICAVVGIYWLWTTRKKK